MKPLLHHVLLVDDDPDDRDFFVFGMKILNAEVRVTLASDCMEMLLILEKGDITDLPDFIVIDYNMPELNGPSCLKAMNASTPYGHIPKVVWSTSSRRKDADECLAQGAVRFVTKPVSMEGLAAFIKSLESLAGSPKSG